jgi:hypothetical protein
MSDSLSTIMAIGVPRGISLVPSGKRSFAMKPSSYISKSTVALSVSIPASTTPGAILSPTFLFHFFRLPY